MNFLMIQPWLNVLKDQQSGELRRIQTTCPSNKKLINRKKTTLHKDGSSALLNIVLEKEGGKKKKDITTQGIRIRSPIQALSPPNRT